MIRFLPFAILLFLSRIASAQQDLSLPHLWHLSQQNSMNPASIPDASLYINLPDLSVDFQYSGPSLDDVLTDTPNGSVIDVDRVIEQLHPTDNEITTNLYAQSYRLIYNTPRWSIQQFYTTRFQSDIEYPKALAQLAWQGNAPFIGQQLEIGPAFEIFSYQELGIGGSVQLGKFRLGANFKFLSGIGAATSRNNHATVTTSDDIYQLSVETDYEVFTADFDEDNNYVNFGIARLDFSGISLRNFRLPDFETEFSDVLFHVYNSGNKGFAVDFGAVFQPNEQWQFGLSVLDIGQINWDDNAIKYQSNETTIFNGLNLGSIDFSGEEDIFTLDNLIDTLVEIVNFTEESANFSTSLANQVFFQSHYTLNDAWHFGWALYGRFGQNIAYGTSFAANYKVKQFLNVGAVYALQKGEWLNIGLNTTFQIGPLQLYFITNNILTAFQPYETTNQTARVGAALVF